MKLSEVGSYGKLNELATTKTREELLKEATLYADFANGDYRLYEGVDAGVVRGKSFADLFDFTRGSEATGWGVGSLETVAVDTPRFVYSPEARKRQGLLIEEQRKNLLLYSDYQGANNETPPTGWSIGFSSGATSTKNSVRNPGGIISTQSGTNQREHYAQSGIPVVAGTTYTLSAYFYEGTSADNVILSVGGPPGTVFSGNTGLTGSAFSGEGRYSITFTVDSGSEVFIRVGLGCTAPATGTVVHETPQLEQGSTTSSYIPTTSARVTRAEDNCSRTLGAEFSGSGGTLYVEADVATGDPIVTIGSESIVSDFDGMKRYAITYNQNLEGETLVFGNGTIKSFARVPRVLNSTELSHLVGY